jgi:phage/plasmid primase-like uncharacterized protein
MSSRIDQAKASNDLVEVVGRYVALKKTGATFVALCPFHNERTPSFNVHPGRQRYHCFGCGAGGDVIDFVMTMEGTDLDGALAALGGTATPSQVRQMKAEKSQRAEEERRRQAQAAKLAAEMLAQAQTAQHPYLEAKGLKTVGLVYREAELLVPMWHGMTQQLAGLQRIFLKGNEWAKLMLPGMKAAGAVFRIGRGREKILCEGFATGWSLKAAADLIRLNATVVVCFSAWNLQEVGRELDCRIYADNDKSQAGRIAAEATGRPWVMSDTEGHDANDDHQKKGLMAVAQKLIELRKK